MIDFKDRPPPPQMIERGGALGDWLSNAHAALKMADTKGYSYLTASVCWMPAG